MIGFSRPQYPLSQRDAGAAMIIAIMVITVMAVMGTSIAVLATRSIRAAGDTVTAGEVKDLANAGLAAGVTWLRQNVPTPAMDADVFPSNAACVLEQEQGSPEWTREHPAQISAGAGQDYVVWIEKVSDAQGNTPAVYRVCAEGEAGQGSRTASVEAEYTPAGGGAGPYAVYSEGMVEFSSNATNLKGISAFSETCIDRKANDDSILGLDQADSNAPKRPAAAHSMEYVLGATGNPSCADQHGSVHFTKQGNNYTPTYLPSNSFKYDTDLAGGSVVGLPGADTYLTSDKYPWKGSTAENFPPTPEGRAAFQKKWNVPNIFDEENKYIEDLKRRAQEQGNYYSLTSADIGSGGSYLSRVKTPSTTSTYHPVVFLDFAPGSNTVDLDKLQFTTGFQSREICPVGKSLMIVVRNANVTANTNNADAYLRASVIVKNGGVKMNGGFWVLGGLFAENSIQLLGNGGVELDGCAVGNPPPAGTPQVKLKNNYKEHDRG